MISIIVPVYNIEKYIERCIRSVLTQTYEDFELILVDDGSTDSSGKICDEYAQKDSRILAIHKPNGGLSDARNIGIESSNGDYIMFLDGDDWVDSLIIEVLYKNITKYEADISACTFKIVDSSGKISRDNHTGRKFLLNTSEGMASIYKTGNLSMSACCKLYRREVIGDIRYPLGEILEDQLTTYLIVAKSNQIIFDDTPLYNYFYRSDGLSKGDYEKAENKYIEHQMILEQYYLEKFPEASQICIASTAKVATRFMAKIFAYDGHEEEIKKCMAIYRARKKLFFSCRDIFIQFKILATIYELFYVIFNGKISNNRLLKRISKLVVKRFS